MMFNIQQLKHQLVRGGLKFDALSFGDIEIAALPSVAHVSVEKSNDISVSVDDTVLTGQPLTNPSNQFVASHASVSGKVISITDDTVCIQSDKQDTHYTQKKPHPKGKDDYQRFFRSMGLVGLGGAAFPVDKKLNSLQPTTLLVNAAECDPAIYCDEALMQERSAEIIQGIQIAINATGASQCIIGIEDNKTKAIEQMKALIPDHMQMISVPAIYPSGAEKTLMQLCTGKTGSLNDNNTICFNVATCYAIYQSIEQSRPLISRIVSVVENNLVRNFEVRIGTPLNELPVFSDKQMPILICGGQMMGWPVTKDHCVDKQTNSILCLSQNTKPDVTPCIRCGACEDVCPESLLPQHLFWHSTSLDTSKLQQLKLDQCIECGCCDVVCPSQIPLAGLFSSAKHKIKQQQTEQNKAALAKLRYEKHLARQTEKTVRQRRELDSKTETLKTTNTTDDAKKALIAKALQRKKNKEVAESDKKPGPGSSR